MHSASHTHTHTRTHAYRVKYMQRKPCWLAGCFLALALLPASPLCDLMQVLPHSSTSPSLLCTFSISLSFPYCFFTLYLYLFSCCSALNSPLCMYHIISLTPSISLSPTSFPHTLACFHCLSPSVSPSCCRVRSGNSLFVMFSLNISSPFPEELFFPFISAQELRCILMLSHR